MISVDEAMEHVRKAAERLPAVEVALGNACGLRLAESISSQIDSPPFDKSMVDGYAVSTSDRADSLRVIEEVTAGEVPHRSVEPGTTIRVMTGAPIPAGADAMVKWEDVEQLDNETIRSPASMIDSGNCVMPRGSSFRIGQCLLAPPICLRPVEIGLLAELGRAQVQAIPRPRVAVLPTGNELVESDQPLSAGQIRNSNGPLLLAALSSMGIEATDLGIGRDNRDDLQSRITAGLEADVLIVSGGVSAGVLDLVPEVLEQLGTRCIFHKVKMKPGKPLWFGMRVMDGRKTLVFGLPGNPVSSLVSFRLFVRPLLDALAGHGFAWPSVTRGVLSAPLNHRGNRPSYQPCRIDYASRLQGLPSIGPIAWHSSADLAKLTRANGLAKLEPGNYRLEPNSQVNVISL